MNRQSSKPFELQVNGFLPTGGQLLGQTNSSRCSPSVPPAPRGTSLTEWYRSVFLPVMTGRSEPSVTTALLSLCLIPAR